MLLTRFSKLVSVAAALAVWVTAGYGQSLTANPSSVDLGSYTISSDPAVSPTASFVVTAASSTVYTATATLGSSAWYNVTCGGTATAAGDICTITLDANYSNVDSLSAGATSDILVLQPTAGGSPTNVTVSLTAVAATSPTTLTTASTITLTYVSHGVANQTAAKQSATILSTDSGTVPYTVANTPPSWLTVTPATGQVPVNPGADTVAFVVSQAAANALPPGVTTTTIDLAVAADGGGVLPIVVTLNVVPAQPLTWSSSSTPVDFGYVRASSTIPPAIDATIQYAGVGSSTTLAFTVNPATVPIWLTVSTGTGIATSSGATAVFTPSAAVLPGLASGNYSANVFFTSLGAQSSLSIPVVLTVSNTAATVSIKEGGATIAAIFAMSASPVVPIPTVTVLSSDEPVSFDAVCAVTTTDPTYVNTATTCQLKGASTESASVSGVAYTWGTPMTAALASGLFSTTTPYGALITVTVTVKTSSQTLAQIYTYSVQPAAPTLTALSPTSAAEIAASTSLVVTLTGANFVGPGNIVNGAISQTRVWAGATELPTADVVVISSTTLVVSIPAPLPALGTAKTVNLVLGVANQTGASAPLAATATKTLVITTSPVVYAVTSTATYTQPTPGSLPKVAPFELVSIFVANFTAGSPVTGAVDAFGRFGTTVAISGSGSSAVNLSVSFKSGTTSYSAPVLYASATQINAIVPSLLPLGSAAVTVTSGTLSSDGNFGVTVVSADPGIFTISSEGVGQGAILNSDATVNQPGNETTADGTHWVSIYMTGLGAPNSTGLDAASNTAVWPAGCVELTGGTSTIGYLQVANTNGSAETPTFTYTKPTTAWTNLDGVVINPILLLDTQHLSPCFLNGASTAVSVTFGSGSGAVTQTVGATGVLWAGFASGSVAGLYQINVFVPNLAPSSPTTVPVQVTLGTEGFSPAGVVTMAIK
jgi:uncharacterized protein (TIGR03437 family)